MEGYLNVNGGRKILTLKTISPIKKEVRGSKK